MKKDTRCSYKANPTLCPFGTGPQPVDLFTESVGTDPDVSLSPFSISGLQPPTNVTRY